MKMTDAEKEWLRRMCGAPKDNQQKVAKRETTPCETPAAAEPEQKPKENITNPYHGFKGIAGMNELKEIVTEGFINVLKYPKCAKAYGITPPALLLYGPKGCGKTFFARKMAEELGINFMPVAPDDIACTWVHGTQEKIGQLFKTAEKNAPTLLFFDEFEAMVPHRRGAENTQSADGEVNEFLCMLNNAAERGIYVIAATNHPDMIDSAVLRTGRIDKLIYIDMPDKEARKNIFSLALSKLPVETDIDINRLAELTDGFNCSDIDFIVKSAAVKKFNATINGNPDDLLPISQILLEEIISKLNPSVSKKDLREYERLRSIFSPKDQTRQHVTIGFK
ncbi:MAG: AAA family ATPase [Muribaculaceae bacterium]